MVPLVDLICLLGSYTICVGSVQRLHRSGVTLVPGQDRNRSGAASRHKGGLAGWGVKEGFLTQFTPSPASLCLLPQPYRVTHGPREWHLGSQPEAPSYLTQQESFVCSFPSLESLCTQLVTAGSFLIPMEAMLPLNAPPGFQPIISDRLRSQDKCHPSFSSSWAGDLQR